MRRTSRDTKTFPANEAAIPDILSYAEGCLKKHMTSKQLILEYRLAIEEVIIKLISTASSSELTVECFQRLNQIHLKFGCAGEPVILIEQDDADFGGKILEEYQDYMNQSYASGVNYIEFLLSSNFIKLQNLIALVLAIVCGMIIRLICSDDILTVINDQIFLPIIRFYAGCMQTIATPVVLFSIMALIVKLQHKFEHNSTLIKSLFDYIATSLIAFIIGSLVIKLLPVTNFVPDLSGLLTGDIVSYTTPKSIIEMFTFTNLLEAFQIANPIPMLIVSILAGIAASRVHGLEGRWVRNGIITLNSIFIKMLSILYDIMPVFLFCSVLTIVIENGWKTIPVLLLIIVVMILLEIPMWAFYALQLLLSGVSPVRFFREYKDVLKENYRIGSNIQALSYNKRMIARRTKISSAFLKEHLSLGAMVNMDGNCLILSAYTFFLIQACHISVHPIFYVALAAILILLSIGAPNQPGSYLIGMVFIMGMIGVSTEMYDTVILVEALLGTAYSFVNSVGDIVTVISLDAQQKRKENKK